MKQRARHSGFTLIELIMVIVLLGIIAVVAAPRLLATRDLEARGFHDETIALLRFAQKTAIAQRRIVCVAFNANPAALTLTIGPAAGVAVPNPCPGAAMLGPDGQAAQIPTPQQAGFMNGISYAQVPAGGLFFFDALGQPFNAPGQASAAQFIQVATGGVAIPQTITVEAGTGYAHN